MLFWFCQKFYEKGMNGEEDPSPPHPLTPFPLSSLPGERGEGEGVVLSNKE
jgi:hypothetical protein